MKKLVHIIEDDIVTLQALKVYINKHGYDVKPDFNGNELDLHESPPLIYFVDVNLKGKSGIDVCKEIKAKQAEVPVILISANKEIRFFISVCNADGFIPKPLDIDEVLATIDKFAIGFLS